MKVKSFIIIKILLLGMGSILSYHGFSQDLKKHQWENRVVILLSSDESSPLYTQQLKEFSHTHEEMKERKLVMYQVINETYCFQNFAAENQAISWKQVDNHDLKINDRNDFFKIILIGLDGGVKLEKTELLKKEELFRIIDSMPMRMNELRRKND